MSLYTEQEKIIKDLDTTLFNLRLKLKEANEERKSKQKESSQIKNRINLLKSEEVKTWKRIEYTRNKTKDKAIQIQNKLIENQHKENLINQEIQKKENNYIKVERLKQKEKDNLNSVKSNIHLKAKSIVLLNKIEKKDNKRKIDSFNNGVLKIKKQMFQAVKQMEFEQTLIKKEKESERKDNKIKYYINKLAEVNKKLKEDENKLNLYENEELEILKRMHKSTKMLNDSKIL